MSPPSASYATRAAPSSTPESPANSTARTPPHQPTTPRTSPDDALAGYLSPLKTSPKRNRASARSPSKPESQFRPPPGQSVQPGLSRRSASPTPPPPRQPRSP